MKYLLTLLAAATLLPVEARASLARCYEIAIADCGLVYDGQDIGDDDYKKCIESEFDKCDRIYKSPEGPKLKALPGKEPLGFLLR